MPTLTNEAAAEAKKLWDQIQRERNRVEEVEVAKVREKDRAAAITAAKAQRTKAEEDRAREKVNAQAKAISREATKTPETKASVIGATTSTADLQRAIQEGIKVTRDPKTGRVNVEIEGEAARVVEESVGALETAARLAGYDVRRTSLQDPPGFRVERSREVTNPTNPPIFTPAPPAFSGAVVPDPSAPPLLDEPDDYVRNRDQRRAVEMPSVTVSRNSRSERYYFEQPYDALQVFEYVAAAKGSNLSSDFKYFLAQFKQMMQQVQGQDLNAYVQPKLSAVRG